MERFAVESSRLRGDPVRYEPEAIVKQAGHTLPTCEVPGTVVTGGGWCRGLRAARLLPAKTALQTHSVRSPSFWAWRPRLQHLLLVLGSLSAAQAPRPPDSTVQGSISARLQLRRK